MLLPLSIFDTALVYSKDPLRASPWDYASCEVLEIKYSSYVPPLGAMLALGKVKDTLR